VEYGAWLRAARCIHPASRTLTFGIPHRSYGIHMAQWAQLLPASLGLARLPAVRIPKTTGQA
jgi:hypothetical protein